MAGIVRYICENNCDIVFLQEVWVSSDFEIIRDGTKNIYKFAHLYRSGSVLGSSGIVILCKWLPKVIHFEPYSLNGSPFYPWHGDWFAGKGIAYSRVDFDGLSLHLFSTHTHAYYKENESIHDQYSVHRVCQSYQLAKFITFISDTASNRKASGKDLLIVAGDMNATSSQLPYKILTNLAGLTDCFKTSRSSNHGSNIIHKHKVHQKKACGADVDESNSNHVRSEARNSLSYCLNKLGDNYILDTLDTYRNKIAQKFFDSDTDDEDITYCHPKNSFTPSIVGYKLFKMAKFSQVTASKADGDHKSDDTDGSSIERSNTNLNSISENNQKSKKFPMKRIDYILCRLLTHGRCTVDRIATNSEDSTIGCSLSDHEPVMVELKISDVSHDLVDKNHIESIKNNEQIVEHSRPLASVVDSKPPSTEPGPIEETTNQWVPEQTLESQSYQKCNLQVMEDTRDVLKQYYQYNRTSKTQMFYVVLFMYIITLPTTTYYAIANDLIPMSTIVFMWFATSFIFAIGILAGFVSYRFEQGAIEAILNDITCKMSASKNDQSGARKLYSYK